MTDRQRAILEQGIGRNMGVLLAECAQASLTRGDELEAALRTKEEQLRKVSSERDNSVRALNYKEDDKDLWDFVCDMEELARVKYLGLNDEKRPFGPEVGLSDGVHKLGQRVQSLEEQLRVAREALEQIVRRVALVSPYYEMARAAIDAARNPA